MQIIHMVNCEIRYKLIEGWQSGVANPYRLRSITLTITFKGACLQYYLKKALLDDDDVVRTSILSSVNKAIIMPWKLKRGHLRHSSMVEVGADEKQEIKPNNWILVRLIFTTAWIYKSKLSAGHNGIIGRPWVITDSAPSIVVTNFYSSFRASGSIPQPDAAPVVHITVNLIVLVEAWAPVELLRYKRGGVYFISLKFHNLYI